MGYHIAIFLTKVAQCQARTAEIVLQRDSATATAEYGHLFRCLTEAENDLGTFVSSWDRQSHDSDDFMMVMHLASIVKAWNIMFLLTNLSTHDPKSKIPLEVWYKRREYCLGRVRDAAWKILAAAPDLIADLMRKKYNVFDALFQALKLVWPLTAVRLMPSTLPHQKAQAAQHLLLIGRQLGVRQATRSYSMVDGIPDEARRPKEPPLELTKSIDFTKDLCTGYLDAELREPTPEELVGDTVPVVHPQEGLDFFMI